jgi:hypothetical protein
MSIDRPTDRPEQTIIHVWLHDGPTGDEWLPYRPLPLGGLVAVTASELLRDLTEITTGQEIIAG